MTAGAIPPATSAGPATGRLERTFAALASAGLGKEVTEGLIREFMEANPDITVEGVGVPSNEILSRVQADIGFVFCSREPGDGIVFGQVHRRDRGGEFSRRRLPPRHR